MPKVLTDVDGIAAFSPSDVWIGWATDTQSYAAHWDGSR
jgi:hypothetical protein